LQINSSGGMSCANAVTVELEQVGCGPKFLAVLADELADVDVSLFFLAIH